jgi:hypothetical protein
MGLASGVTKLPYTTASQNLFLRRSVTQLFRSKMAATYSTGRKNITLLQAQHMTQLAEQHHSANPDLHATCHNGKAASETQHPPHAWEQTPSANTETCGKTRPTTRWNDPVSPTLSLRIQGVVF